MRTCLFSGAPLIDNVPRLLGGDVRFLTGDVANAAIEDAILAHRCRLQYDKIGASTRDGSANDRWRHEQEPAFRDAERAKIRSDAKRMAARRELIAGGGLSVMWIATSEVNTFDACA
jgi:hypothetical protein